MMDLNKIMSNLKDVSAKRMVDIKTGTAVANALIVAVVLYSRSCKPLR